MHSMAPVALPRTADCFAFAGAAVVLSTAPAASAAAMIARCAALRNVGRGVGTAGRNETRPRAHDMQRGAPKLLRGAYFPAGHSSQLPEPAPELRPAPQDVQVVADAALKRPAGQRCGHSVRPSSPSTPAEPAVPYRPGLHGPPHLGVVSPQPARFRAAVNTLPKRPGVHAPAHLADVSPPPPYRPSGQIEHCMPPPADQRPGAQRWQLAAPTRVEKRPAAHELQLTAALAALMA
jgi:hypothetical protein